MVHVHILPAVAPADRQLTVDELTPDEALLTEVAEYLDERRVIGMSVRAPAGEAARRQRRRQPPGLAATPTSSASSRTSPTRSTPTSTRSSAARPRGIGEGWEFGRALNQGELYGIVRKIDGVEFIKILRVYETDLATGKQDPKPAGSYIEIGRGRGDRLRRRTSSRPSGRRSRSRAPSSSGPRSAPGADEQARLLDDEPARAALGHRGPDGRLGARLPAHRACRASTRTATSACASSSRSRRCSTRSSARSTSSTATSTRRSRRATCSTCSPPGSG